MSAKAEKASSTAGLGTAIATSSTAAVPATAAQSGMAVSRDAMAKARGATGARVTGASVGARSRATAVHAEATAEVGAGPVNTAGLSMASLAMQEDISERLWRAEYIDSSEVTIAVKDGAVTLSGTVPERWMRHEIENIADNCMGVQDIENSVRVQRPMIGGIGAEMAGARGPGGERP